MKLLKITLFQLAIVTTALFCGYSCSTDKKPEDTKEVAKAQNEELYNDSKKEKDALFLVNAAEINLEEIQIGQLAQQKSKTTDIIAYGKMIEEAHRKSLSELNILAAKKAITIPTSFTDNAQDAYKKLLNVSDVAFDKEFCNMMVNGHKDAITKFDKESEESKDSDIKTWAIATLPNLHSHLEQAIICQKNVENMK